MPTVKRLEPCPSHVDPDWLHTARTQAARTVARFATTPATRFARWLATMIQVRELLAAIPAEGSPCTHGDEVDRARHLLLGGESLV